MRHRPQYTNTAQHQGTESHPQYLSPTDASPQPSRQSLSPKTHRTFSITFLFRKGPTKGAPSQEWHTLSSFPSCRSDQLFPSFTPTIASHISLTLYTTLPSSLLPKPLLKLLPVLDAARVGSHLTLHRAVRCWGALHSAVPRHCLSLHRNATAPDVPTCYIYRPAPTLLAPSKIH